MWHPPDGIAPGQPYPLGATVDDDGVNFAIFSAHAEKIELCLFDPGGRREIARYELPECTNEIWHGYLPTIKSGQLYGYRVHGPYLPEQGHRFNPHKLLLDPYAKKLAGTLKWTDALFGYRLHSPRADLSFDRRDSAAAMPKAVVVDELFRWGGDRTPPTPMDRSVIYEAHVRGLTIRNERIRADERGTFAALARPRDDRLPRQARRDGDRAAARACVPAGPAARRARTAQLLGLQHARVLRARAELSRDRRAQRDAHRDQAAAFGRHPGDPRRRLQPHLRGERARPDAVVPQASTTRATTACCRTTRATASTTPAAATR